MRKILTVAILSLMLSAGMRASQAAASPAAEQAKPVVFPKLKPKVPQGSETYAITQPADVLPRIVQATIDPPDVHVGMTQHLSIVIQDPGEVTSVEADIETDHGTVKLPLTLVGPVAQAELVPQRYYVDGAHRLALGDPEKTGKNIAYAAAPKMKYAADWIVRDTHDTKYHTTFVVKDAQGRKNSITLAWSDACSIPVGGAWNLANYGNCTISATDGVDNGAATIATYTLSISNPAVFAWNSGQSITISSGAIAVAVGASLVQTNLWMIDTDNDGHPDDGTMYAQSGAPTSGRRRYVLTDASPDCSPGDGSTYQYLSGYYDNDGDGHKGSGPSSVCSGGSLPAAYAASPDDCNDFNGYIYQNSYYVARDADADHWVPNSFGYTCVGNSVMTGDSNFPVTVWAPFVGSDGVNNYYTYETYGVGRGAVSDANDSPSETQSGGAYDCDDGNSTYHYSMYGGYDIDHDQYIQSNNGYVTQCVGGSDGSFKWYYWNGSGYWFINSPYILGTEVNDGDPNSR
jgi:hypothetical protein